MVIHTKFISKKFNNLNINNNFFKSDLTLTQIFKVRLI
jgi:hypothetical protein